MSVVARTTLDGGDAGIGQVRRGLGRQVRVQRLEQPLGAEVAQRARDGMGQTSSYLFGRKTYEDFAAHWPHESAESPIAASLNATPKYVATRTLEESDLEWANSEVLDGDLVESVRGLKEQGDGSITVLGSGVLVQTLIANDLVDAYRIMLHPLIVGTGKRLLGEYSHPVRLRLTCCTQTTTGVLLLTYERDEGAT